MPTLAALGLVIRSNAPWSCWTLFGEETISDDPRRQLPPSDVT
jgi:hypothetical protein